VMNEHEAASLRGHLGLHDTGFEDFAVQLHKLHGVTPLVTLGAGGAIAYDGQVLHRVSSLNIKAVDTIGAGDAFCGFLAAAIDAGQALPAAMRVAAVAGAMACTKIGAQEAIPDMGQVKDLLSDIIYSSKTL
jgi:ribokinase